MYVFFRECMWCFSFSFSFSAWCSSSLSYLVSLFVCFSHNHTTHLFLLFVVAFFSFALLLLISLSLCYMPFLSIGRSMLGNRDSEIAIVTTQDPSHMIDGVMNGNPYKVSAFAHDLRRRSWAGFVGLSKEEESLVADPVIQSCYWDMWYQRAVKNTDCYKAVFPRIPSNARTVEQAVGKNELDRSRCTLCVFACVCVCVCVCVYVVSLGSVLFLCVFVCLFVFALLLSISVVLTCVSSVSKSQ
jgi:hypothetical protein